MVERSIAATWPAWMYSGREARKANGNITSYRSTHIRSQQWIPRPIGQLRGAAATRLNGMCLTVQLSIYGRSISNSFVEIAKSDGDVIEGYFRGLDRNTGTITISPHMNAAEIRKSIGVKTLSSFNKFSVDRLGRKFKVHRELRTWRGKACT